MAQEARREALNTFTRELQAERMVLFTVGNKACTTFTMQEAVLVNISPSFTDLLKRRIEHHTDRSSMLRLPEDLADPWKILLYWKIKGSLPRMNDDGGEDAKLLCNSLVHCWLLGDKYGVHAFQDLLILELLEVLLNDRPPFLVMKLTFAQTSKGSPLFELMVEEAAAMLTSRHHDSLMEQLEKLEAPEGFALPVLKRMAEMACGGELDRVERLDDRWMEYMMDGGLKKHWIFGQGEDGGRVKRRDGSLSKGLDAEEG